MISSDLQVEAHPREAEGGRHRPGDAHIQPGVRQRSHARRRQQDRVSGVGLIYVAERRPFFFKVVLSIGGFCGDDFSIQSAEPVEKW